MSTEAADARRTTVERRARGGGRLADSAGWCVSIWGGRCPHQYPVERHVRRHRGAISGLGAVSLRRGGRAGPGPVRRRCRRPEAPERPPRCPVEKSGLVNRVAAVLEMAESEECIVGVVALQELTDEVGRGSGEVVESGLIWYVTGVPSVVPRRDPMHVARIERAFGTVVRPPACTRSAMARRSAPTLGMIADRPLQRPRDPRGNVRGSRRFPRRRCCRPFRGWSGICLAALQSLTYAQAHRRNSLFLRTFGLSRFPTCAPMHQCTKPRCDQSKSSSKTCLLAAGRDMEGLPPGSGPSMPVGLPAVVRRRGCRSAGPR